MITSRRHLTALEDTHTVSLDTLPSAESAELLIRLSARPDLSAGDAAVKKITDLCGHLPLAIGIIARQLHHHPAWSAAGLASDLATARDRLTFMHAENLSVDAAFDLTYKDLSADQQQMFCRLGLHPGTEIDAYTAAALDGSSMDQARRLLCAPSCMQVETSQNMQSRRYAHTYKDVGLAYHASAVAPPGSIPYSVRRRASSARPSSLRNATRRVSDARL